MSQESDNDGFFAGFAALENEENDQSYTDNSNLNKSTLDTSSSNNSAKNNLKTASNATKPVKYNNLIQENSQTSQTDESETEEGDSKENINPENPGYFRKNLNESADTEEEDGMRNERHRSERAYINHLKSLKCADTCHVKPATTATSIITKHLPDNFLESTLIPTPHQHQIMNILNYRCLQDKQEAFSPQIILERLSKKPILSESSISSKNSERAKQAQHSADLNRKEQILSSLETWNTGCLDMVKNLEKTTVAELNDTQKVRNSDIFESFKNMERVVSELGLIVKKIKK